VTPENSQTLPPSLLSAVASVVTNLTSRIGIGNNKQACIAPTRWTKQKSALPSVKSQGLSLFCSVCLRVVGHKPSLSRASVSRKHKTRARPAAGRPSEYPTHRGRSLCRALVQMAKQGSLPFLAGYDRVSPTPEGGIESPTSPIWTRHQQHGGIRLASRMKDPGRGAFWSTLLHANRRRKSIIC